MADTLIVRAYNVRFGDAILVEFPEVDAAGVKRTRRILIDVGNALNKEGGADTVFKAVVDDILQRLAGDPLDLYVMTHEHLDHCQGLCYYENSVPGGNGLAQKLKPRAVWLTGSADPDYYQTHPKAAKEEKKRKLWIDSLKTFLMAHPDSGTPHVRSMLLNNDPRSTETCVQYLRDLLKPAKPVYVHRDWNVVQPFQEARLSIWAPEEDTSVYYGKFQPAMLQLVPSAAGAQAVGPQPRALPPSGVDAGAFYNLVDLRTQGFLDTLLNIDKAANNTSVVLCLEWRGWRLLFAGDAEIRSWKHMEKAKVLKPVHFLKVSHHSSHNGTPADIILDKVLPPVAPDGRPRTALISTWEETYGGIPHTPTIDRLKQRCQVVSTIDDKNKLFVDVPFAG